MCEQTQILGVDRDGAFAEYVVVPESVIWPNDRTKLPPEIATLQEPFGNAVFATSKHDLAGQDGRRSSAAGPSGSSRIAIARASGAGRVLASDRVAFRLELARTMGATDALNIDDVADVPAGSSSRTRASTSTSSSRCPARRRRSATRSGSSATAATSSSSGSPSRPVELDVAESLIFKNLTVHGRERPPGLRHLVHRRAGCSSTASSTCDR